jgi:hypothetical protein
MGVFELLFVIAFIGLVAYGLQRWVPMSEGMKQLISIVAIVVAVIFVLTAFGLIPRNIPVPRLG